MEQQRAHKRIRLDEGDDDLTTMSQLSREEALQAVKNGAVRFEDLPEDFRDDTEIAVAAIDFLWRNCEWISPRLKNNKEFFLEAVKFRGLFLMDASEKLRNDRELVLEAVRNDGWVLMHASEELRVERDIVLAAVRQYGRALRYVSVELRADREVVMEAVRQDGDALHLASEELRADREIVLAAVRQASDALRFASEELQGDREIVLAAVRRDGGCLRHASEELRGDKEIALLALENTVHVALHILPYLSNDIQNDPVVAGAILRKGGLLRSGSEIVERLGSVLHAVRSLPEDVVGTIVDEESVIEFSRRWEHSVWHKIWIALQLEPPGMQGTGLLFVELSDLPLELRHIKELRHCAPVIGSVVSSFPDRDWRDLNSY